MISIIRELIFFLLFFGPWIGSLLGFPLFREYALALVGITGIILYFLPQTNERLTNQSLLFVLFVSFLFLGSSVFWVTPNTIGVYFGIVFAVILVGGVGELSETPVEWIRKRFTQYMLVSVVIASVEWFFGHYLFVVVSNVGGEEYFLNESLFSGAMDIVRAKGLHEGPLTLSQASIILALLNIGQKRGTWLAFMGALLSASRTGILLCGAVLFFYYIREIFTGHGNGHSSIRRLSASIILMLLVCAGVFILSAGGSYADRLLEVFDFQGSGSNRLRLYFWTSALDFYSNFGLMELFFGKSGAFRAEYIFNPESGWLTLLVDNGLMGLLLHFVPLMMLMFRSVTHGALNSIIVVVIIIVATMVFTFNLGAIGSVFFWVLIFRERAKLRMLVSRA